MPNPSEYILTTPHRVGGLVAGPQAAKSVRVLLDCMGEMHSSAPPKDISRLLAAFRQGDKQATNDLIEVFYPQLRRLAGRQMSGERAGHSWQPTVLVNELYLELLKIKALPSPATGGLDEK